MVKVLPEPVTPNKTWLFTPEFKFLTILSMASGWSPVGLKVECNLKLFIFLLIPHPDPSPNLGEGNERGEVLAIDIWVIFG